MVDGHEMLGASVVQVQVPAANFAFA